MSKRDKMLMKSTFVLCITLKKMEIMVIKGSWRTEVRYHTSDLRHMFSDMGKGR